MKTRPRVLLLEPDPELRDLFARFLERQRMHAAAPGDEDEARSLLARETFDLLWSDCSTAATDHAMIQLARAADSELPVLCLTTQLTPLSLQHYLSAGAHLVLRKPVGFALLGHVCRGLLRSTPVATRPVSSGSLRRLDEMMQGYGQTARPELAQGLGRLAGQWGLMRLAEAASAAALSQGPLEEPQLRGWLQRELGRVWSDPNLHPEA
ncbi:MAG: response regulator [Candidatus Eremiobacteraeota bacterium]|nr:response regulator [Candidatus Eremiobacteraeota bacterium]